MTLVCEKVCCVELETHFALSGDFSKNNYIQ